MLPGWQVSNHRTIAMHYLRTWFMLDLITVFPADVIMPLLDADAQAAAGMV
jgi:hypothetical protein